LKNYSAFTAENHENPQSVQKSLDQDLNPEPPTKQEQYPLKCNVQSKHKTDHSPSSINKVEKAQRFTSMSALHFHDTVLVHGVSLPLSQSKHMAQAQMKNS
jgi:hypothetical protein